MKYSSYVVLFSLLLSVQHFQYKFFTGWLFKVWLKLHISNAGSGTRCESVCNAKVNVHTCATVARTAYFFACEQSLKSYSSYLVLADSRNFVYIHCCPKRYNFPRFKTILYWCSATIGLSVMIYNL